MNRLLSIASVLAAMGFGYGAAAQTLFTNVSMNSAAATDSAEWSRNGIFPSTYGVTTQNGYYDVFVPIAKYLACGDTESLSAWFADNLEITILHTTNDSSKNQARQILKSFFNTYTPRDFQIMHNAGRANLKYALGSLNAGGEIFMVTIFVSSKDDVYKIQQLKIERIE